MTVTREELVERLERRRDELGRLGALVDGGKLCDQILGELEAMWRSETEAELSLAEAAAISGYSADHLRRLARSGKLQARRRGGRLYVRVLDLPMRPASVARPTRSTYDPLTDARSLLGRRGDQT